MTVTDTNPRPLLYALLARLLLDELDPPLALYLRRLPGLAEHVPTDAELTDWLADLRAEHQRIFGLNVYPYESIFRDRDLMLNTAATQRVVAFYAVCGFAPAARLRAGAPDHLGVELALMAELFARMPRDPAAHALLAELLHGHLAAWLPVYTEALLRVTRAPLYRALAEIATELTLTDLAEFSFPGPHPQPRSHQRNGESNLPLLHPTGGESNLPRSLAWERESGGEGPDLRQIVRRLLTPDDIGAFISRADITVIGHALALPAPIAEREQMLLGLFGAAGQFDLVPALLDALVERLHAADTTYARHIAEHPAWAAHGQAWRGRVAAGLVLLESLSHEHRTLQLGRE